MEQEVMVMGRSISTTVTCEVDEARDWIVSAFSNNEIQHVGFEVEIDRRTNKIGTVQLCVGRRCLIFQLHNRTTCPVIIDRFFSDLNNRFVGIGMRSKLARLKNEFPFKTSVVCMDLGETAARRLDRQDLRKAAQGVLAFEILKVEVVKPLAESDWSRPVLTDRQVEYACIGAFLSLEIAKRLVRPQDPSDFVMRRRRNKDPAILTCLKKRKFELFAVAAASIVLVGFLLKKKKG